MKAKIKVEKEIEVKYLYVDVEPRYWEDATINGVEDSDGTLTPCRNGERWQLLIDINTGIIKNWPKGISADIHFKVCDAGYYRLEDEDRNHLLVREDYVPKIMCPEENGFGDYIIMKIDDSGQIANWHPSIDDWQEDDD